MTLFKTLFIFKSMFNNIFLNYKYFLFNVTLATGPVCHFFYLYLDKVVPPGGPVRLALR